MYKSLINNIFSFFLIFALSSLVGILIIVILLSLCSVVGQDTPLRLFQLIQSIFMFIIPAYIYSKRESQDPFKWLGLKNKVSVSQFIMASLAIIISIPFNGMIYDLNRMISFPEFMKPIEEWLWERHNDDTALKMLLYDTPLNLLYSLFIVGIVAGFSEEIFFRGGLQKLLYGNEKITSQKAYASIVITSLIFSAFHLDFFGFFPRFIIGGLFFGVLYYWTGALWLTIWSHLFYNSTYFLTSIYLEK